MLEELQSIVGADHAREATQGDAVDGALPRVVAAPGSAEEVARAVRYAAEAGLRVAPRGGGTKLGWGNPPAGLDVVLTTARLDRVLEHAWGDMTATVEAGCTVAQLQATLAEHGQRLALDPLWPARATVGGVLATNDAGLLRTRFGGPRDQLIGIVVALADGTLARSGGKVVKNVAGYDLPKLMIGALGTLGVIVEATFRLYPLPQATRDLTLALPDAAAMSETLLAILDSTLAPSAVQVRAGDGGAPRIDLRFEGLPAALDAQERDLGRLAGVPAAAWEGDEAVWGAREALWRGQEPALVARLSVLPGDLGRLLELVARVAASLRLGWRVAAAGLGTGLLRLDGANDEALLAALVRLREEIAGRGGSLVALGCPPALKERIDVWGGAGDALPLMRRVKESFDPAGALNPGRYVGKI